MQIVASGPPPPSSSAIFEARFLLYCTDSGKFILKLEGDGMVREFDDFMGAVAFAHQLRPRTGLTVYSTLGKVVLDAFV